MKKVLLFSILTSFLLVQSCKEKEETPTATITFISPAEHTHFMAGDEINIKATIEASTAIHGWNLFIIHGSDQSILFEKDSHEHAQTINIDESWIVPSPITSGAIYVKLEAIINHDGDKVDKSLELHIH